MKFIYATILSLIITMCSFAQITTIYANNGELRISKDELALNIKVSSFCYRLVEKQVWLSTTDRRFFQKLEIGQIYCIHFDSAYAKSSASFINLKMKLLKIELEDDLVILIFKE